MTVPVQIVLGKTGEALVNRVSNAIGVVFEPHRMRRAAAAQIDVAKAEMQAEIIRAEGRLKISEIETRGLQRMIYEEGKNQENIESITAKAIPHLSAEAKPEALDQDFVRYLFDKAKLVSNEEMQEIWAKILAREASKPESFSRRTMDLVSQMSKADAELFVKLVRNVWVMGTPTPIIPDFTETIDEAAMTFAELHHLDTIGLIRAAGTENFTRFALMRNVRINYYHCPVVLEFPSEGRNHIVVGKALFTAAGSELIRIVTGESSRQSFDAALQSLFDQQISISIPIDAKEPYLAL